jgi:hypothetical protein
MEKKVQKREEGKRKRAREPYWDLLLFFCVQTRRLNNYKKIKIKIKIK